MYFMSSCFPVKQVILDINQAWFGGEPSGLDQNFRELFDALLLARTEIVTEMGLEILPFERRVRNRIAPAKAELSGGAKLSGDGARLPIGQANSPDREDKRQAGVLAPGRGEIEVVLLRMLLAMGDGRIADEQLRVGGFVGRDVGRLEPMELAQDQPGQFHRCF